MSLRKVAILATIALSISVSGILAKEKEEAQPFPKDEAGNIVFQGVVAAENVPAAELFTRAKFWAAKAFNSAQNVIQLDDPASGRLVLKGSHEEPFGWGAGASIWFHFTLTIEIKDGRYRWTIDQLGEGSPRQYPLTLNKEGVGVTGRKAIYERFRKFLLSMAQELQVAMTKAPAQSNW